MRARDITDLFKDAAVNWVHDYAQSMGAALAFYTMFSAAPLLLIVISIAGFFFGEEAARGEIFVQLQDLLGATGAMAVQNLIESAQKPGDRALPTVIGAFILFIGATSVLAELQDALDRIWRAPLRQRSSGLWGLVRARLLSFGMILGIGFLLIVSLAFSAGLTALAEWWDVSSAGWANLNNALNLALSLGSVMGVFALIYKTMPRARVDWKDVWIGAGVTSVLFLVGKTLIGHYIGRSGVTTGFGAAASLIVVLLWVYYSAQIFLFGAEFTWVYSHKFGSRKGGIAPHGRLIIRAS